jgi:hypothetical protein
MYGLGTAVAAVVLPHSATQAEEQEPEE